MATEFRRMQQLRGAAADWTGSDLVLLAGELGFLSDPGGWRFKVGDGTTAWSSLGFIGETDATARADIATLSLSLDSLDDRVAILETAGTDLGPVIDQVTANTAAIAGKQDQLAPADDIGAPLFWDGTAWSPSAAAPVGRSVLTWDATAADYVATAAPTADGDVLTSIPAGVVWQAPVRRRALSLAGTGAVEDAFNLAAPTVEARDALVIVFDGLAWFYTGASGIGLTTATAGDFVLIGTADPTFRVPTVAGDDALEVVQGGAAIGYAPLGSSVVRMEVTGADLVLTTATGDTLTIAGVLT